MVKEETALEPLLTDVVVSNPNSVPGQVGNPFAERARDHSTVLTQVAGATIGIEAKRACEMLQLLNSARTSGKPPIDEDAAADLVDETLRVTAKTTGKATRRLIYAVAAGDLRNGSSVASTAQSH